MLNVTLLKVRHSDESEAKKLLPHIRSCDVYAKECGGQTEKEAIKLETMWRELLTKSRSEFLHIMSNVTANRSFGNYELKQWDYLFRQQKPLFFMERWPDAKGDEICAKQDASSDFHLKAMEKLENGNTVGFLKEYIKALQLLVEVTKDRDMHIAEVLCGAESKIRKANLAINGKEVVNYTLSLGEMHNPEKYSSVPIAVVHLTERNVKEEIIENLRAKKGPAEWPDRDILALGILDLAELKKRQVDEQTASFASFEELVDTLRRLRK